MCLCIRRTTAQACFVVLKSRSAILPMPFVAQVFLGSKRIAFPPEKSRSSNRRAGYGSQLGTNNWLPRGGDRHHWWVGWGGPFFVLLWPRPPCVPPVPGVGIAGVLLGLGSFLIPFPGRSLGSRLLGYQRPLPLHPLSTLVGGPDAWLALSRCSELPSGCRTPTPPILVSGYPYAESTDSPDGPRLTDSKGFFVSAS